MYDGAQDVCANDVTAASLFYHNVEPETGQELQPFPLLRLSLQPSTHTIPFASLGGDPV